MNDMEDLDACYWPVPVTAEDKLGRDLAVDVIGSVFGLLHYGESAEWLSTYDMLDVKAYLEGYAKTEKDWVKETNDLVDMAGDGKNLFMYGKSLAKQYVRHVLDPEWWTCGGRVNERFGYVRGRNIDKIAKLPKDKFDKMIEYVDRFIDDRLECVYDDVHYDRWCVRFVLGKPKEEIEKIKEEEERVAEHAMTVRDLKKAIDEFMEENPELLDNPVYMGLTTYYGSTHDYGLYVEGHQIVGQINPGVGFLGFNRSRIFGDL